MQWMNVLLTGGLCEWRCLPSRRLLHFFCTIIWRAQVKCDGNEKTNKNNATIHLLQIQSQRWEKNINWRLAKKFIHHQIDKFSLSFFSIPQTFSAFLSCLPTPQAFYINSFSLAFIGKVFAQDVFMLIMGSFTSLSIGAFFILRANAYRLSLRDLSFISQCDT